jgi:hypothetical protein
MVLTKWLLVDSNELLFSGILLQEAALAASLHIPEQTGTEVQNKICFTSFKTSLINQILLP